MVLNGATGSALRPRFGSFTKLCPSPWFMVTLITTWQRSWLDCASSGGSDMLKIGLWIWHRNLLCRPSIVRPTQIFPFTIFNTKLQHLNMGFELGTMFGPNLGPLFVHTHTYFTNKEKVYF